MSSHHTRRRFRDLGVTTEIATNITGVSIAADSTTQALDQTRTAVDELSRMAAERRSTVSRFTSPWR